MVLAFVFYSVCVFYREFFSNESKKYSNLLREINHNSDPGNRKITSENIRISSFLLREFINFPSGLTLQKGRKIVSVWALMG
ncbi:hypothetical protein NQ318_011439 [Aromia moschata]|uniref:Uncharacterized protein n=1 Tax=Aromia moschata TaxID=1265417 RepID=A0AAV8YTE9_9CUCU|nr:hypothetical protein NQ318_011439 [Aromia moschata]